MDKADALEGPEANEGFANHRGSGHKAPVAAVQAVKAVVTQHEVVPFRHAHPKFPLVLLNEVAIGIPPRRLIQVVVGKSPTAKEATVQLDVRLV